MDVSKKFIKKDFDGWNKIKKQVEAKPIDKELYFHEREVWWCSAGVNIGIESDGKNGHFERPILIVKKFNGEMIWIVPLTSKEKSGSYYQRIVHDGGISWVYLSQLKTISSKRLMRKIGMISEAEFDLVVNKIGEYIKIGPRISTRSSEAEATNN